MVVSRFNGIMTRCSGRRLHDPVPGSERFHDNDAEEKEADLLPQVPNDPGDRGLDRFCVRFPLDDISIIYSREVLAL